MTLIWFALWFIFNLIGDKEPLLFSPVNFWAGTLLLAIAIDLGSLHASPAARGEGPLTLRWTADTPSAWIAVRPQKGTPHG